MARLPSLSFGRQPDEVVRQIRFFQSETAEIQEAPDPLPARVTLYVAALMVATAILLASVVKVDRVVESPGEVVSVQPTVVVQPLDDSIVRSIDVREGQQVHKGDLLATLDPTFAAADVGQLTLQSGSLHAQIARLQAEQTGQPLVLPSDGGEYNAIQQRLYDQRKLNFTSQVQSFDQKIALAQATLIKLQNDVKLYTARLKISADIERMRAQLEAQQFGSKLNLLQATDQRLEIQRTLDSERNQIDETTHQLASAKADRDAFVQQWQSQVQQDLVQAQNTLDTAQQQLGKAQKHQDLVRLTAPGDAVVLNVAKVSVGSVLRTADQFLTLVPTNSAFEAEVKIDANEIGYVQPGDSVNVKLLAYDFMAHGSAEGRVQVISEDAFTKSGDGTTTPAYYKARVAFTKVALQDVPSTFRLIPGMQVTADIHVGNRTLISYLIHGALRGLHEGMREP